MVESKKYYLTKERYQELKKELDFLKKEGLQKVAKSLKFAKELGDLSENSEYQEAREEQIRVERRIAQLEEILNNVVIIEKNQDSSSISLGSTVKVKNEDNNTFLTFTIVGSKEAQPLSNKISNESPLGKSLLGKKIGDLVEVETPKGKFKYRIIEIE